MAPLSAIMASAAAASLAARGFSYHDNNVRIRDTMGYNDNTGIYLSDEVSTGTFVVTEISISSGQDPQTKNNVGDVHHMSMIKAEDEDGYASLVEYKSKDAAYPGFTFTAGRHKTADVANFWNTRIPPTMNTFGHTADALNFAFIGDMTLTTHDCGKMLFSNIGLAQGSESAGNNWWFGGKDCTHTGDNKVHCDGFDENGVSLSADFRRGGAGQIYDVFLDQCYLPLWG